MKSEPGTGWKIFTAVYLFWTGTFFLVEALQQSWSAIVQLLFLALASYWFYRVWFLKKGIKMPFIPEW